MSIALKHGDITGRREAVWELVSRWNDDRTLEPLREISRRSEDSRARRFSIKELLQRLPDEEARQIVEAQLQGTDCQMARIVITLMSDRWKDERTRTTLSECASDPKRPRRARRAVQCLAEIWRDDATKELLVKIALEHDQEDVAVDAVGCLATYYPRPLVEAYLWSFVKERLWTVTGLQALGILVERFGVTLNDTALVDCIKNNEPRQLFGKPQVAFRYVGASTKAELRRWINSHFREAVDLPAPESKEASGQGPESTAIRRRMPDE